MKIVCDALFLSTPSGWRATRTCYGSYHKRLDFYPRPPGGGRPAIVRSPIPDFPISIHALRVEGDSKLRKTVYQHDVFLSTPSGWRATRTCYGSYHKRLDFYPRPPGGGRPLPYRFERRICEFLSTPSGWRATSPLFGLSFTGPISIHALRVEGDTALKIVEFVQSVFLSTPSGWRATLHSCKYRLHTLHFYPRPPGGGRPAYSKDT